MVSDLESWLPSMLAARLLRGLVLATGAVFDGVIPLALQFAPHDPVREPLSTDLTVAMPILRLQNKLQHAVRDRRRFWALRAVRVLGPQELASINDFRVAFLGGACATVRARGHLGADV